MNSNNNNKCIVVLSTIMKRGFKENWVGLVNYVYEMK